MVVVNRDGKVLDAGSATGVVNAAGFVVHSAVHIARPELHAVMHTHEPDAAAVSAMSCGILPLTQDSIVIGPVASHAYEGIAVDETERVRMGEDMGPDAKVMLLRNHGILIAGQTIPEMFTIAYFAHKACRIQVRAMAAAAVAAPTSTAASGVSGAADSVFHGLLSLPSDESVTLARKQALAFNQASGAGFGQLEWQYLRRKLDRLDESYKD